MGRALLMLAMLALCAPVARAADAALERSLHDFFERGVMVSGARAELTSVQRWPNTRGAARWSLPALRGHPAQLFLIAEQGRGSHTRRWYVPVRVHWWARAVVAREDIPARAVISRAMLTVKRTDIAGRVGRWWRDPAPVTGLRANRPIAQGEVIASSAVRRMPLIQRGREVTILAARDGVRVTALGKALRAANAGEMVRVQNLRSKQIIQARVLDAHTVQVERGGA